MDRLHCSHEPELNNKFNIEKYSYVGSENFHISEMYDNFGISKQGTKRQKNA